MSKKESKRINDLASKIEKQKENNWVKSMPDEYKTSIHWSAYLFLVSWAVLIIHILKAGKQ